MLPPVADSAWLGACLTLTERACGKRQGKKAAGAQPREPDRGPGSAALHLSPRLQEAPTLGSGCSDLSQTGDLWRAAPRTVAQKQSLFTKRMPSRAPPDTGPEHAVLGAAPDTEDTQHHLWSLPVGRQEPARTSCGSPPAPRCGQPSGAAPPRAAGLAHACGCPCVEDAASPV